MTHKCDIQVNTRTDFMIANALVCCMASKLATNCHCSVVKCDSIYNDKESHSLLENDR